MSGRRISKKRQGFSDISRSGYVQIMMLTLVIISVASFYIYQRVWVRNLIVTVDKLEEKNKKMQEEVARLESEWRAALTVAELETRISEWKLGLRPTLPDQNLALRPNRFEQTGRFNGLVRAFDKLRMHLPFISLNEAEAEELFEKK